MGEEQSGVFKRIFFVILESNITSCTPKSIRPGSEIISSKVIPNPSDEVKI